MRAVNLLPREAAHAKKKSSPQLITGVVGSVLVTTILCAGFLMQSAKVSAAQNDLDAARAELALIPPPPPAQSAEQAGLAGEETQRVTALQSAMQGRVAWDRVLREVSLILPKDIWLSSLTLSTPDPAVSGSTQFQMLGKAYSHDGVARLLSRLALVPDLTNAQLDHSSKDIPGKHSTVDFKITAGIRPPGAAS